MLKSQKKKKCNGGNHRVLGNAQAIGKGSATQLTLGLLALRELGANSTGPHRAPALARCLQSVALP